MEKIRPTWDETFFEMASILSKRSKDKSTQVGAVIVGPNHEVRSVGYNCFPRGINDDLEKRQERPIKYKFFEHAERNAIYNAARVGTPLEGCKIYIPFYPCSDCARAIIQSGIIEVVVEEEPSAGVLERFKDDFECSLTMLSEAHVMIRMCQRKDKK